MTSNRYTGWKVAGWTIITLIALGALAISIYNFWYLNIRVHENLKASVLNLSLAHKPDKTKYFTSEIFFINSGNRYAAISKVTLMFSKSESFKNPEYVFPWDMQDAIVLQPNSSILKKFNFERAEHNRLTVGRLFEYLWSSPKGNELYSRLGFTVISSSGTTYNVNSGIFSVNRNARDLQFNIGGITCQPIKLLPSKIPSDTVALIVIDISGNKSTIKDSPTPINQVKETEKNQEQTPNNKLESLGLEKERTMRYDAEERVVRYAGFEDAD